MHSWRIIQTAVFVNVTQTDPSMIATRLLNVEVYSQVARSPSPSQLLPAVAEPVRKLSFRLQRGIMTVQQRRAHNIDRLSRRLFPLAFVVFNVVYWLSYML